MLNFIKGGIGLGIVGCFAYATRLVEQQYGWHQWPTYAALGAFLLFFLTAFLGKE